jgi:hypothetical protein
MSTATNIGATSKQVRKPTGQQDRELTEDELKVLVGGQGPVFSFIKYRRSVD